MEFDTIKDAFDRVTKKQKLSSSKSQEVIGQIYHELEQVLQKIQLADNPECQLDLNSIFSEFKTKLKDIAPLTQLESTQKELNVALTKYPKLIEKSFNPDISKAYRNVDFDRHTVNQIIASHFYRQGMFELGDCFISEAGESESASSLRSPLQEMYQILEAMKSRNLEPALNWALNNANKLQESGSDLLLKLHSMQFMEILLKDERHDALKYARTYLAPLASHHMAELQKLMACLLWSGKLECSPYSQLQLLSAANWDKVAEELIRQFCNFLGQSYESPLGITVAAGIQGLPPLLKFMNVMVGKRQEWQTMKQLPVPVELDREFQFHSIFVCPVSKEESTEENPPMLMICGHVLCKQSIMKMSKNSTKSFKCPYCPTDIDASRCRQLYF